MQFPSRDLTNQYISLSYQDVVQRYAPTGSLTYLLDGYGYVIGSLYNPSLGGTFITTNDTASWAITASYALNASSGSSATASYALFATSASYAATYSHVTNSVHATIADYAFVAEYAEMTSQSLWAEYAGSSSYAFWSSHSHLADTASEAIFTKFATHASTADIAIFAYTSSYALASAVVGTIGDDTWYKVLLLSGSSNLMVDNDLDIIYNPSLGQLYVESISSSCVTASLLGTSSWSDNATSASYANLASMALVADVSFMADTASIAAMADAATSSSWASHSLSASWAPMPQVSDSASWASSSISASYAEQSNSSSYANLAMNVVGLVIDNTSSFISISGSDVVVIQRPTGSYNAVWYEYVVLSGSNVRAGTVFGAWTEGLLTYSETSNTDVGDTSPVSMSIAISQSFVQLIVNTDSTINWTVKSMGRYL